MKNVLFLLFFICQMAQSQTPIPLSVTVEDMDLSILNKTDQGKWQKKILKFADPVFASDCTPEQQTFNRTVIAYGRTVVASKGFEDLLRRRMREKYGKCNGDPFYASSLEAQINQVLAVCRAPKAIRINCTGGSGNASTSIGAYDLLKTPEVWWGGWFKDVSPCVPQNNCIYPYPWPYSQSVGIIWHELMHQYGYVHGANNPDENNIAKTNCGIPASNTTWHFQFNTVPYIVGDCVSEMITESQKVCGDIRNCPSPNQIQLVDKVGGTTCSCVNDPGKKGLGILDLKNGKIGDVAMLGDNDWIGGWHYSSPDNKIVGSGDFDGDGNRDFILYSNWGIGIVTYKKPNWQPLIVKPNGTWFGGWNFNTTQNTVAGTGDFNGDGKDDILIQSSWGIGILTFDGSSSLISLLAQPRDTWFGAWRWDATVNTGRDKIHMVADLNKDGKTDILVTSSWGIGLLTLVGNTMTAYVAKPNGTWFGGWNFDATQNSIGGPGDFNGDGKADILIQSASGLGIMTFDGTASLMPLMTAQPRDTWFGAWRWDATINAGRDNIKGVGDFNGDGKADILVTSSWGVGILTLNNATLNAYLAKPNGTRFGAWNFNSADNQIVGIADFNNDRRKDIVIRSPWGIGLLALNGQNSTLNSLDMQPYKSFLGSWVIENTDKIMGVGNFENTIKNDELLVQKN